MRAMPTHSDLRDIAARYEAAVAHRRADLLAEAESPYRATLTTDPNALASQDAAE